MKYQKIKTVTHKIKNLSTLFYINDKFKKSLKEDYKMTHRVYVGNPNELKITLWKVTKP